MEGWRVLEEGGRVRSGGRVEDGPDWQRGGGEQRGWVLEGGGCETRDLAMAVTRSRRRDWTAFGEGAWPLLLERYRWTGPAGWVAGAAAGGRRSRLGRGAVAGGVVGGSHRQRRRGSDGGRRVAAPIHGDFTPWQVAIVNVAPRQPRRRLGPTGGGDAGDDGGRAAWYWSRVTMAAGIFSESVSRRWRRRSRRVSAARPRLARPRASDPLQSRADHGLVLRLRSRPRSHMRAFSSGRFGSRARSLSRPAAPLPGPAHPPRPCAASESARRRQLSRVSSAARPRHRRPGASEGCCACPALLPPYPVGAPASSGALGPAVGGRAAGRPAVHHRHYYTNCFDIIRFLPCTGHEALIQHPYIHVLRASEHRRRPAAGVSNSLRISQLWAQRRYTM
jgi:hypothetical protein